MDLTKTLVGYFLIAVLTCGYAYSQTPDLKFDHLTVEDGLSSNTVYSILQDSRGFMWFGTSEGLNRYDGQAFKVYRYDPGDTTSISDNFIWFECLGEDEYGAIWVGTRTAGLNRFDRTTETFKRFQHDPKDVSSLSSNNNITVFVSRSGTLLVGTDRGVNRFDHATETFERFQHNPDEPNSLAHDRIWDIRESVRGEETDIWIGTHSGLDRFNMATGQFEPIDLTGLNPNGHNTGPITALYGDQHGLLWLGSALGLVRLDLETMTTKFYRHDSKNSNSLNFNFITAIWQDPGTQGRVLWITTRRGLNRFDTETETFNHYPKDSLNPEGLNTYSVVALHEDKQERLWIGSHSGGINKLDPPVQKFNLIKHDPENPNSLIGFLVSAIYGDMKGTLWIGTEYGLNKWDRDRDVFVNYTFDEQKYGIVGANVISGISEDNEGQLWLGTRGGGLIRFDPETGTDRQYLHDPNDPHSLADNQIGRVFIDSVGALWSGTTDHFLSRLLPGDREAGRFMHFGLEPEHRTGLTDQMSFVFAQDSYGGLWIGSPFYGLYRFNFETRDFVHYQHDPDNSNSLSSNTVSGIFEVQADDDTTIWVGTDNGLNLFDRNQQSFKRFYNKEPGGSDFIFSLTGDTRQSLWMTNQKGISKFETRRGSFVNYAGSRGLPADMSNTYGYHRSSGGELFFGGMGGLIYFHPDSISSNPHLPPVRLTDFKVLNESFALDSSITLKGSIELSYDQNFFAFEFAALDYTDPKKNQYAYWLEGLDEEWVYTGRAFANYTAVPPGSYVFRVKGSNNDGVWNDEGTSVRVHILPPWWRTWWAYAFYVVVAGLILYGIRRFELNRTRIRNELEKQTFEASKLKEVDELKSRFFANVSHEFRTPLTLILGPLEKLLRQDLPDAATQQFQLMQRNAQRLRQLINQLLDLSKVEAGKMKLAASCDDILKVVRTLVVSFSSLADRKGIDLNFSSSQEKLTAYFDTEKLEKVISNLLSNALKFTPENGAVSVSIMSNHSIEIKVSDTGPGIPDEHRQKIFDRFHQLDGSNTREQDGTGIGLALTKEFVELHHGKIQVDSEVGKGTTFTVSLPLGRNHLSEDEIVETGKIAKAPDPEDVIVADVDFSPEDEDANGRTGQPVVLVVDDNHDMRRYIYDCLADKYNVLQAETGESGLELAMAEIPDLIVSDVMMPEMDGFELCEKLKTDQSTSHIPIILLTARASGESKVEGLETGADDYLIKPFDADELEVRIKNLVEQRQKLKKRFQREIVMPPGQIAASTREEEFLQKAMALVQEEMADPDFGVPELVRSLAMSRVQLHRKFRALTGLSTSGFIRTLRLKRAAELLRQRKGTVAEIAYEVGFNNVPYFQKCFREQFEKTPGQYISSL